MDEARSRSAEVRNDGGGAPGAGRHEDKRLVVAKSTAGLGADIRIGDQAGMIIWTNVSYDWATKLTRSWNVTLDEVVTEERRTLARLAAGERSSRRPPAGREPTTGAERERGAS
jgi:hypothetical protein